MGSVTLQYFWTAGWKVLKLSCGCLLAAGQKTHGLRLDSSESLHNSRDVCLEKSLGRVYSLFLPSCIKDCKDTSNENLMAQRPFLSSALSPSCCFLSLLRPPQLAGLEFGFKPVASRSSHQQQPLCPKGQNSSLDTSLWLNFLGGQVPWLPVSTNQLGNQQVGKICILRRVNSKWAWSPKRIWQYSYEIFSGAWPHPTSSSCFQSIEDTLTSEQDGSEISHHHEVTSCIRQLLTAVVSHCGYTQLFFFFFNDAGRGKNLGFQTLTSYLLCFLCLFTQLISASSREGIFCFKSTVEQSASRCQPSLSCCSVISSPKHGAASDPLTFFAKAFINSTLVFIATHQAAVTNIQLYLRGNGGFICSKGYTERQRPTVVRILGNTPAAWWKKRGELE